MCSIGISVLDTHNPLSSSARNDLKNRGLYLSKTQITLKI